MVSLNPNMNNNDNNKYIEDMSRETLNLYNIVSNNFSLIFQINLLKIKLDEIETRMASLEKENKDTQFNNS